jgi:hypothetical protein
MYKKLLLGLLVTAPLAFAAQINDSFKALKNKIQEERDAWGQAHFQLPELEVEALLVLLNVNESWLEGWHEGNPENTLPKEESKAIQDRLQAVQYNKTLGLILKRLNSEESSSGLAYNLKRLKRYADSMNDTEIKSLCDNAFKALYVKEMPQAGKRIRSEPFQEALRVLDDHNWKRRKLSFDYDVNVNGDESAKVGVLLNDTLEGLDACANRRYSHKYNDQCVKGVSDLVRYQEFTGDEQLKTLIKEMKESEHYKECVAHPSN